MSFIFHGLIIYPAYLTHFKGFCEGFFFAFLSITPGDQIFKNYLPV